VQPCSAHLLLGAGDLVEKVEGKLSKKKRKRVQGRGSGRDLASALAVLQQKGNAQASEA